MKKKHTFTICSEPFSAPMHICAFFDSREEQYQTLLPWIKEGINNNEEVINILHGNLHGDHCSRLSEAGIQVEETVNRGQLKVLSTEDTYLNGGAFAAERMATLLEQALIDAKKGPYGTFRGYGDMEWALENLPGTDELIEYEARINIFAPKYACSIICAYDINKFSGNAVANILATHPYVILHGKIHKNPHYMDPIELLQKLIHWPKKPLANMVQSN